MRPPGQRAAFNPIRIEALQFVEEADFFRRRKAGSREYKIQSAQVVRKFLGRAPGWDIPGQAKPKGFENLIVDADGFQIDQWRNPVGNPASRIKTEEPAARGKPEQAVARQQGRRPADRSHFASGKTLNESRPGECPGLNRVLQFRLVHAIYSFSGRQPQVAISIRAQAQDIGVRQTLMCCPSPERISQHTSKSSSFGADPQSPSRILPQTGDAFAAQRLTCL